MIGIAVHAAADLLRNSMIQVDFVFKQGFP